ncbi:MAG TPA: hypothetical protein VG756_04430 [Pseudonocardiaceae bacterium]|nr:hypothetical protein [Pseudonocardiaceae bacterium]
MRGTSRLPMQALGAPPSDLPPAAPSSYTGYQPVPPQQQQQQYGQQQSQYPPSGPRPVQYPPSGPQQSQYPPSGPQPIQQRPGGAGGGSGGGRSKTMDYALKGLGLLGVAVVSGFLYWLFMHGSSTSVTADNGTGQDSGTYQFAGFHGTALDSNCQAHATDQVQKFLQSHQCQLLTRSLYTTSLSDGEEVVTSVAVVKLANASQASQLRQISDGNATGHVKDLVEENVSSIPGGPTNLENGGYASEVHGNSVIIAVTEFTDKAKDTKANLKSASGSLAAVSKDALRLGESS